MLRVTIPNDVLTEIFAIESKKFARYFAARFIFGKNIASRPMAGRYAQT